MTAKCILCGSSNKRVVRDHLRYGIKRKVLQCARCSFVYLEPPKRNIRSFYEGKEYRKKYGPVLGKASAAQDVFETYSPYQGRIISQLQGVLKKNSSVLDVGCSAGQFLNALKGKVKTRVGLELSADEVTFIREHLDFPVYNEPIETTHIKEGPFDLITCLQTLEHVERPVEFLAALGKNLKPNGYLYLELPNINDALISQYNIPSYADFYFREPHLWYFSESTLRRALKKAGFNGTIKTVQRYSLLNYFHWMQTGLPQPNFRAGNDTPLLVEHPKNKGAKILNAFIARVDAEYKQLLGDLGLGESLTFLGKKVK
jgi:2-polyprenyl-3-methyl-5-hydroxy-6-metoxy-1,4-benzoquinol methylase